MNLFEENRKLKLKYAEIREKNRKLKLDVAELCAIIREYKGITKEIMDFPLSETPTKLQGDKEITDQMAALTVCDQEL